jgi:hypothetical protein
MRAVTALVLVPQPGTTIEAETVTEDVILVPGHAHDHAYEDEGTHDHGHQDEAVPAADAAEIDRTNVTEVASPTDTTSSDN